MPKIAVQNVNVPDQTTHVDAAKDMAMRAALMLSMSPAITSLTYAALKKGVLPHLPEDLFPQGAMAGWWIKTVQLDLEAKGQLLHRATKPMTWSKV